ncbi:hypothetical protein BA895_16885 [Humibacillus sp. DSM 29435]|nr:hypothetical protein BA895_16885 [Humibacillus sp. DSM 29435]
MTTPPVTTPPTTPPQTAPGYGPPGTGGAGSSNPANLAIGSGLLLLAGAITITDVAQRRRRATTGK